jgi:hypothetical protein
LKYIFFTALWEGPLGHSKAYFDHILDLQLRVIGEELKDEEVEYHIVCTNQTNADYYQSIISRDSRYSSSHIRLSVVPMSDGIPPQIKLNHLSQVFIKERENSGDVLIYNVPDYVYSRGTFKWIKDGLAAGKKICSIYTPKIIRELALESIDDLNSIQLWNSVKDYLHEGHLKQFVDSEIGYIKYPSGIYFRTEWGHVCFPITMHPFVFCLDRTFRAETYTSTMSIEQGLQSCYAHDEFCLQRSIEEFLILELTKMELPWADDTDYSGYSHELITNWFRFGEMEELQRFFIRNSVAFRTSHMEYNEIQMGSAIKFHQELINYVDTNYYNNRN